MDDCIEYQGCKDKYGYGIKGRYSKSYKAHRLAYCDDKKIHISEIDGMVILHICDNTSCINPKHLKLGYQQDNLKDMVDKNRHAKGIGHGMSKITELEVVEIRRLKYFHTQIELAKMFNLSQAQVSGILTKRFWKHIGGVKK